MSKVSVKKVSISLWSAAICYRIVSFVRLGFRIRRPVQCQMSLEMTLKICHIKYVCPSSSTANQDRATKPTILVAYALCVILNKDHRVIKCKK